ncbi:MAG: SDR family NAD(P)-dependent oxidoreductase [Pyrinomonadaceae bacterium]
MPGQSFRGFTEKVALVLGGARGVGRAVAVSLALEGAYVVVHYAPGDEEGGRVAGELRSLGTLAETVEADLSRPADVRRAFDEVGAIYGRLDLLVNAAGLARAASLAELSEEVWDEVLGVSLKGAYLCAQAAVPLMRGRPAPAIVNLVSEAGLSGRVEEAGSVATVAAQAGVAGLTKALARELAPQRVRVNCVAFGGPVATPSEVGARSVFAGDDAGMTPVAGATQRPVVADEVARACLYLLSADARSINGETLFVSGLR